MLLSGSTSLETAKQMAQDYAARNGCKVLFFVVKNRCHQVVNYEYYLEGDPLLRNFEGEPDYVFDGEALAVDQEGMTMALLKIVADTSEMVVAGGRNEICKPYDQILMAFGFAIMEVAQQEEVEMLKELCSTLFALGYQEATRNSPYFDMIGHEDWLNTYQPVRDRTGEPKIFNPRSEAEWELVAETDPYLVWTVCEEDGAGWYYLAGFHRNNVVYHHICQVPWTKLVLVVEDDDKEECDV